MQVRSRAPMRSDHSAELRQLHDRLLAGTPLRSRFVETAGGEVHVLEQGTGVPVVFIHGTGGCGLFWRPLLQRVEALRAIAPDRPGQGLSEPVDLPRDRYREAAVSWVDRLFDALGLDKAALVGHSMGGLWATWYALARPDRVDRLVMIGAPALPQTSCPLPYRAMCTPGLGALLARLPTTSKSVLQFARLMGEGTTLAEHPDLLELMVALGADPVSAAVRRPEAGVIVSPFALLARTGFRRRTRVQPAELRRVAVPTLVIWGDRDPVGGPAVARAVTDLIPGARLELLPAGHVPWLGHPDRMAAVLDEFLSPAA